MDNTEQIYLGGGCFWCVEASFQQVPGVLYATSGYAGGHTENPTYEDVCTGRTGHAEVVKVTFDPDLTSLSKILDLFFEIHDPTSLNKQGGDVGTQYRSAIYTTTPEQLSDVMMYVDTRKKDYTEPIVTDIKPLDKFYEAEDYHQDYFIKNPKKAYCQVVIAPKVEKVKNMV